ncbi:MAG: protease pro-enzyme activation domain-containing protein [Candidatus Acidiferrum sp.]
MMKTTQFLCRALVCVALLVSAGSAQLFAQQKSAVPSRITEAVDDTRTVTLHGNVHPLARPQFDQGAVPESQPMTRMMLLLQRSPAQELALRQLLDAQQTKGSSSYHAWMTPAQFGAAYGPADSDVQAVTDWLTSQGFQISKVAAGKTVIEFDGTVGQVRNAFHTEIHKFLVNGKQHFANISDPAIPEALAPVVAGTVALNNFDRHPYIVKNGLYRRTLGSKELEPLFTYGNPANYALGPGDFAKIYNIPPTATGAGQSIAVIAQTNINTQDVANFRSMFSLPPYSSSCSPGPCLNIVINGVDPGILGPDSTDDEIEADLDTQWSGAIAPAANIYLVVSQSTQANPSQVSMGVDLSALYAVDNNIAGIITDSYGNCEAFLGTTGNQFYNSIWEQAAAEGITVSVAAGDSGSAGCDPVDSLDPYAATQGVAINGLASTPFNTALGGTDFDPSTIPTGTTSNQYWNATSDTITSALMYIPEITWDDSACALAYPTTQCASVDTTNGTDIKAGSGGPSNCITSTTNSSGVITCAKTAGFYGYLKPSFQTPPLTPNDGVRDIPDVSFFASNGGPPSGGTGVAYVICQSDTNPQGSTTPTGASCNLSTPYQDFTLVGGTSAATPAFAAVMALVDQTQITPQNPQGRQGNANYVLYSLAASDTTHYGSGKCATSTGGLTGTPEAPNSACIFNDVTKGNNAVACDSGTPNCSNTATTSGTYGVLYCPPGSNSLTPAWQTCPAADNGATSAFQSSPMYDLATGLGSINVGNLLANWTSSTRTATTTALSGPSGGSPSGSTFTATVTVTPSGATGDVSFIALNSTNTVLGSFGPFTLSGGTAPVTTNLLPPGTTSVQAIYGGNATYASSTSASVALSAAVGGASYTSQTTLNFVSYNTASGAPSTPTTAKQNFTYGTPYILQIVVSNNGKSCAFSYPSIKPSFPCPTGTISLTDNGNPLNDFVNGTKNTTALNNLGIAEDQYINLSATLNGTSPAVHKIVATYTPGDGNYSGSTSNTLQITIQSNPTTTTVASSLASITSGQSVTLTATIVPNNNSNGTAPCGTGSTGTVQFTNNGSNLSGTVTYTSIPISSSNPTVACTATLTTAISSLYPPPTGKPGFPAIPRVPAIMALLSLLLFLLGLRFIPQIRRRAYGFAGLLVVALLVGVIAGCGGGGGGGGGGTTRTIGAAYSGDANYGKSSATTTIVIQ